METFENKCFEIADAIEMLTKALGTKYNEDEKEIIEKNYALAKDIIERIFHHLYSIEGDFGPPVPRNFLQQFVNLLDSYLDLADNLFKETPMAAADTKLKKRLAEVNRILDKGTIETALEAKNSIGNAVKEYEAEIKGIKQTAGFDSEAIILYWKVWRVLDEIIHRLPENEYELYSPRMYGITSLGLRVNEAVVALFNARYDVLGKEKRRFPI